MDTSPPPAPPDPPPPAGTDASVVLRMAIWKDAFQLIREGILILIVGFLLLSPGCVRTHLVNAGFTRASFAGLEMDLLEQAQETAEALTTVDAARAETDSALQVLAEVSSVTTDTEVQRQVDEVREQLTQSAAAAAEASVRLGRQLETQSTALAEAPVRRADRAAVARIDSVVIQHRIQGRAPVPLGQ